VEFGATELGTIEVEFGTICFVIPPDGRVAGFGAVVAVLCCIICENAGALTQIIANANAIFLMSVFPLLFHSEFTKKTDRRDLVFPENAPQT
jgi:hypothetical protein